VFSSGNTKRFGLVRVIGKQQKVGFGPGLVLVFFVLSSVQFISLQIQTSNLEVYLDGLLTAQKKRRICAK